MQNINTLSQDIQDKVKNYNEKFEDIFELLEKAVYKDDLALFSAIVNELEDINIQNKYGWTLLHVTIRRERTEMVELLLEKGADINKIDGVGWTPLMESIMDNVPSICKLLVEKGADKSIANARGATAPMLAQKFERTNMYEYLT
ncbi:ankyrin repeat domain-containing protein [Candidatus Sulfurimonas marisnigri]|uniref:Ankyrin repeat domain-containing protein n=1 Tax=Candidatus Sulfurimonas marisnigri TaxID=2740405 RepID=A0A7S7RPL9_9BACT|nr:ankyrin repeat domain-containing protein [Candidatus Sulfurimonas marisnigri]QOY53741.1 ankyrin repeat domain-containing protein [Candidatus Sulfurimonas marisnigri]